MTDQSLIALAEWHAGCTTYGAPDHSDTYKFDRRELAAFAAALAREQEAQPARQRFETWAKTILGDNPTWRESGDCELAWQAFQQGAAQPAAQEPSK